jgi:hypothetical protein
MGRRYSEKEIRNKQEAGCGIYEVGMRKQEQHKAEDDPNRRNEFPTALSLALAHRLSSAAVSILVYQLSLGP